MGNAFVEYVCPLFGNLLGVLMLLSPLPAVLGIRKSSQLGALNPLPYPLTALNCFGWVAYGLVVANIWLVPANAIGLVAGVYFTLQSLPVMSRPMQDKMLFIICGGTTYFCLLGMIGTFGLSQDARTQMWGIQCVVVLLMYYAIPLTSMYEVIKTKDAASIYPPLAFAAIMNGAMWTVYGLFATGDFNVWMPNAVGCVLGMVQVGLRLRYGKADAPRPTVIPTTEEQTLGGSHFFQRVGSRVHLLRSFSRWRHAHDDHMDMPTGLPSPKSEPAGPVHDNGLELPSHANGIEALHANGVEALHPIVNGIDAFQHNVAGTSRMTMTDTVWRGACEEGTDNLIHYTVRQLSM